MTAVAIFVQSLYASQLARFLAAGVANTLFGYAAYLIGLTAGLPPTVALLAATVIGALWNYLTVARFVFEHHSFDRLPFFVGAYALIYGVNVLGIHLLIQTGAGPALAQAVALPFIAALSFVVFRLFVFRTVRP